jgi:hypothetical protein
VNSELKSSLVGGPRKGELGLDLVGGIVSHPVGDVGEGAVAIEDGIRHSIEWEVPVADDVEEAWLVVIRYNLPGWVHVLLQVQPLGGIEVPHGHLQLGLQGLELHDVELGQQLLDAAADFGWLPDAVQSTVELDEALDEFELSRLRQLALGDH